jgi:hypothetical protein
MDAFHGHPIPPHDILLDIANARHLQEVSTFANRKNVINWMVEDRVVCASVCASVCLSRPSVMSDKVCIRPIRVNVLLTLDRVNLDLLYPRWLPHCCHIAATLDGQGCCGRIQLAEGRIRWRRGAYGRLWGAYASGGFNMPIGGVHIPM